MGKNTLQRVVECIAVTTRYPEEVLAPTADLENDLGIDSVKRVEIVTALADEFELNLLDQKRDPNIRSIEDIAAWIEKQKHVVDENAACNRHSVGLSNETVPRNIHATNGPISALGLPTNGSPHSYSCEDRSAPSSTNGTHSREMNTHWDAQPLGAEPVARATVESALATDDPFHDARNDELSELTNNELSLKGKVALITGSGRSVGRTIARLFAARGARIIVNSFHSRDLGEQTVKEIRDSGGEAWHLWGSVANPMQVDDIFDQIDSKVGFLDILICNASDGRLGSFTDISREDWDRAFNTNVTGHYQCAMRASPLMQRRGGGSIVTMSSLAANRYVQGMGCQGVVKAAVEAMTRNLACELGPYGIRANCISGGPVYGEVMAQLPEARATLNYWESIVPDGELCSPLDLATTIGFLVSDAARAINGAIWTVDHGASTRAHTRNLPQTAKPQHDVMMPSDPFGRGAAT